MEVLEAPRRFGGPSSQPKGSKTRVPNVISSLLYPLSRSDRHILRDQHHSGGSRPSHPRVGSCRSSCPSRPRSSRSGRPQRSCHGAYPASAGKGTPLTRRILRSSLTPLAGLSLAGLPYHCRAGTIHVREFAKNKPKVFIIVSGPQALETGRALQNAILRYGDNRHDQNDIPILNGSGSNASDWSHPIRRV